ncbi:hypothetical protein POL68_23605 [Stigmatella sp. ncwal1]|uniref:Uncharacterized protein n=1 Tax=Stigmatella ashevillensis TaxID=2995309 RepID=A0ABT5DED7_9BACT|nr:hypothetical protein [Stigmatella ashevillena]MDC0711478.1 hypothetical protein [Stigmatella ashevillena]
MMMNVFIILSGGPGVYNPKDPELHDKSWDNYVTSPLLSSKGAALHDMKAEEVHWLVYEPAYVERWQRDLANKKTAPTQYGHATVIKLKHGITDYLSLLRLRAKERGWKYEGISSAQGFWSHLQRLKGKKISRVWFYGHAREDLWLSLTHDVTSHEAYSPDSSAIVTVVDIKKLSSASFVAQKDARSPHRFFGCNTKAFAEAWSRKLKVYAEGAEGKVSFEKIHETGGKVILSPGARWVQYSKASIETELLSKAGAQVP